MFSLFLTAQNFWSLFTEPVTEKKGQDWDKDLRVIYIEVMVETVRDNELMQRKCIREWEKGQGWNCEYWLLERIYSVKLLDIERKGAGLQQGLWVGMGASISPKGRIFPWFRRDIYVLGQPGAVLTFIVLKLWVISIFKNYSSIEAVKC